MPSLKVQHPQARQTAKPLANDLYEFTQRGNSNREPENSCSPSSPVFGINTEQPVGPPDNGTRGGGIYGPEAIYIPTGPATTILTVLLHHGSGHD
jgi:hypothetical protein